MGRELILVMAATTPRLGIGYKGSMPWNLPTELKYFRSVTTPGIVLMGRKTWDSIPKKFRPLKDRVNVVLTRDKSTVQTEPSSQVTVVTSLEEAMSNLRHVPGPIYVIGGAQLYNSAIRSPCSTRLLLTEIEAPDLVCDTFFDFPDWYPESETPKGSWRRCSSTEFKSATGHDDNPILENGLRYRFTMWCRR